MYASRSAAWDRLRQTFADQFEQHGTGFVYRRSQKGEAIRVSAEERDGFIDDFDRNLRRANWLIYIGVTLAIGIIAFFSVRKGSTLQEGVIFVGIGVAMIPYFVFQRWAWTAPARALAGRVPIAGERLPEDVSRLRFQRITYGQLAGAAAGGLLIPFIGSVRHNVFSGWNRLWLVFGGALVLLAAVQAFRKWRIEQEDSLRNSILPSPQLAVTEPAEGSGWTIRGPLRRYLFAGAMAFALAFIFLTPTGLQLARSPYFWPIVMVGCGGWVLSTVLQGFAKGRIEPAARGFDTVYERETQPKRFWASMAWNVTFACLCLWIAFTINRPVPVTVTADPLQDRCYDENRPPAEQLEACTQLIKQWPKDSRAYLHRGLVLLDGMKLDQAIADFTRAHELDPRSPWPLANRGMSYAWKSDRERAEQDFKAVRAVDPNNPVIARGEALLDMEAGDLEGAIADLNAILARDPDDAWSLRMRSDAYQQIGDFKKAEEDRERAATIG